MFVALLYGIYYQGMEKASRKGMEKASRNYVKKKSGNKLPSTEVIFERAHNVGLFRIIEFYMHRVVSFLINCIIKGLVKGTHNLYMFYFIPCQSLPINENFSCETSCEIIYPLPCLNFSIVVSESM